MIYDYFRVTGAHDTVLHYAVRNFDARHGRIGTGAVVQNRKKKASVGKATNAVSGMRSLSRGRSVSRKRSIRGKSNLGAILRQP